MRARVSIVVCSILGAFLIYCGQSAFYDVERRLGDGGGAGEARSRSDGRGQAGADGFVADARAESGACCTPATETFVKIGEGKVSGGKSSPAFSVSGYREIVFYVVDDSGCSATSFAEFRANAQAPFGRTGQYASGRLQVNGSEVRLYYRADSNCWVQFVLAGVKP